MQASAAVITERDGPFQIIPIEVDEPRPTEVRVSMVACGICQTDLHVRSQDYAVPLPLVLGHEGAGVVESVGSAITDLRPGDPVLLSYPSCGHCASCRTGHNPYCDHGYPLIFGGSRLDGTQGIHMLDGTALHGHFFAQSSFSTLAIADQSNVVKLPADLPLDLLAPLGCGIQTGAGTVFNGLKVRPGASLAIFGTGSVGLAAVMAGVVVGADPIIAVDQRDDRLELAQALGATAAINSAKEDLETSLREIVPQGCDNIIDTTARPEVLATALRCLAPLGTAALVGGAPAGTESSIDMTTLLNGRSLRGIIQGDAIPQLMLPELVKLYRMGRLPIERLVTFYDFADINQAADDMAAGKVIKPVLRFPPRPDEAR